VKQKITAFQFTFARCCKGKGKRAHPISYLLPSFSAQVRVFLLLSSFVRCQMDLSGTVHVNSTPTVYVNGVY
jgi:hypothetical protein